MAAGTDLHPPRPAGLYGVARRSARHALRHACHLCALIAMLAATPFTAAQQSSISTWDAADFRIWGYIPYGRILNPGNGSFTESSHSGVPEPAGFVPLLVAAIMGLIGRRR
jgi:hypothetical protein